MFGIGCFCRISGRGSVPCAFRRGRSFLCACVSRSQLGKLPVPDLSLTGERMSKWSYRAPPPPPQHSGPQGGHSQSSQPQMEAGAPPAQYMDLTQEAARQQPPSRFRPQVMVKPAVMLRREERPEPVSFSVTDAAQLSHTLSEMVHFGPVRIGRAVPPSVYISSALIRCFSKDECLTGG